MVGRHAGVAEARARERRGRIGESGVEVLGIVGQREMDGWWTRVFTVVCCRL